MRHKAKGAGHKERSQVLLILLLHSLLRVPVLSAYCLVPSEGKAGDQVKQE